MHEMIEWLNAHEGLAGWAQFVGTFVALMLTAFIARREGAALRRSQADKMKAVLTLTALAYRTARQIAQHLASAEPGRMHVAIHPAQKEIEGRQAALAKFDVTNMTSTFMINNLLATQGQLENLQSTLRMTSGSTYAKTRPLIAGSVHALQAICSNMGREVRRLGGRYEPHDDPQLSLWLQAGLVARVRHRIEQARAKRNRVEVE